MTHAETNPVSLDGLLRWNGQDWVANPVEDSDFGLEKLATLTEAEKRQLANAVRPEKLGWYADPLSDGSSARLWSGSEWTGIVRHRLESATFAPGPSASVTGEPELGASKPSPSLETRHSYEHLLTRAEGRWAQRRSETSTIPSKTPGVPSGGGQGWSTNKKMGAGVSAIVLVLLGLVAVGTAGSNGDSPGESASETSGSATAESTQDYERGPSGEQMMATLMDNAPPSLRSEACASYRSSPTETAIAFANQSSGVIKASEADRFLRSYCY